MCVRTMSRQEEQKKRSGFMVMAGLIGMIKPLLFHMLLAILMGCAGNLMAAFITVLGGYGLLTMLGVYAKMGMGTIFFFIILFAILRGVLRYAEQASNHYIAFKLLASIRHKVFASLRRLAPAKLSGSEKGNLISIITSDIELLEVFYAHTISPVVIAVQTSLFMVCFLGNMQPLFGVLAAVSYLILGLMIPLANGRKGSESGQHYRNSFGKLNTEVLDNLYGLEEIIQYRQQEERLNALRDRTEQLEKTNRKLKADENVQRVTTDGVILAAGIAMAGLSAYLYGKGSINAGDGVIAVIALLSSFGPTAALSALSNNLHHTLASGNRVLNILEEEPIVEDITDGADSCDGTIACRNLSFSYEKAAGETETGNKKAPEMVLDNFGAVFTGNRIHGILGKSGCGKSTLLKLLMRFYETQRGEIRYGDKQINQINTAALRSNISYVTQETFLFHDTIENNIKVAKEDATREEVIAAAKKASIHDFIMSLPDGYETKLAELGDSVSGGEKQRIGIARAFLQEGSVIFLDEPTSNIDSLNEGIILKSLAGEKGKKTIILVSHRKSTMGIADDMLVM